MISVDDFMNRNIRMAAWMGGTEPASNQLRMARFSIPSMTMDEALDFMGYTEDDISFVPRVILPKSSYSKREEVASRLNHLMYYCKREVKIIHECPHKTDKKVRHHFDYSEENLLNVHLLCRSCHARAHAKANMYDQQVMIAAIAAKMFFHSRKVRPADKSRPLDRGSYGLPDSEPEMIYGKVDTWA